MSFTPPPYPHDRLREVRLLPGENGLELLDLSIGTPIDPLPKKFQDLSFDLANGYPTSIGSNRLRSAAVGWMSRRLGLDLEVEDVAACVGSKEFVASTPWYLHLRRPERDVVLYPEVSYPTYAMGAILSGLSYYPVALEDGRLQVESVPSEILEKTLLIWTNSPSNPTGEIYSIDNVLEVARKYDFTVISDECYVEYTWSGDRYSALSSGVSGVLAVHSLSKRSNFAGGRVGFYAGDPELVHYLSEVRKHAGLMIPGPFQELGARLLDDDEHVEDEAKRYQRRLETLIEIFTKLGYSPTMPDGGFYLWFNSPDDLDGFSIAASIAKRTGIIVSPGEFYSPKHANFVRVAAVASDEALERIALSL
ncbi:MAG: aminotransferase class I/II-fold pyridoxal phosphate-dependent enzyme [Actinomycetota bacterium]|nr:aminotransferase class I/II-fold pyridoxal phosphate-dependent enzyme [Actinomycetota bacterium]